MNVGPGCSPASHGAGRKKGKRNVKILQSRETRVISTVYLYG